MVGNIYMILWCHFGVKFPDTIGKEQEVKKLYVDLDRESEVEKALLKQQLAKKVKDAHTQSEISFPISGQSR